VNREQPVVFVVDDDRRIREALSELLSSFDMRAVTFASAAEYMAYPKPDLPACLVLDVELPDINGLDLQRQIAQGNHPQIVFITGHGDIPSSVRAIKTGAVDFLTKPLRQEDLMRAINTAVDQSREARQKRAELSDLLQRFSSLTPREREVLPLVASGLLNKQAAAFLAGPQRVLSRDQLLAQSRLHNDEVYDRAVDVQIGRLRKKMQTTESALELIRTERGVGYVFTAPVEIVR
jgi:FixJ family two-component response regulator